jgi:glycosyltransferase involved in cell wall biosynthesis
MRAVDEPRAGPRVSVIIPAYNVAPYIAEAVLSVHQQTFSNIEVIVVDDGSTDGTDDILRRLQSELNDKPPPLIVIHRPNGGQNRTRNDGLDRATGEYVAFLDGDDRWHREKLARHVALLDARPDLDLTFSWHRFIDEAGRDLGQGRRGRERTVSLAEMLEYGHIASTSLLVGRRSAACAVGGFDVTLGSNADLDFCLRVAMLRPDNIGCLPEVLVDYRRRAGQISSMTQRHPADWDRLLDKVRAFDPALVLRIEHRSRANKRLVLANIAYRSGNFSEARRLYRQALGISLRATLRRPGHWRRGAQYFLLPLLPRTVHFRMLALGRRLRTRLQSPASARTEMVGSASPPGGSGDGA